MTNKKNANKYFIKKLDLNDIYKFLNSKHFEYSDSSMNNIMSRIRKFVRILNNELTLNYKISLPIIEKRKDKSTITNQELISIFKTIGEKRNLQISLIFFFLYYIGLTYSKVARIRIKDFHSSLSILIDKKSKNKKFILP